MTDEETVTLELELTNRQAYELLEAIDQRLESAILTAEILQSEDAAMSAVVMQDVMLEAVAAMPAKVMPDDVLDEDGNVDWELVNEYGEAVDSDFVNIEVE